jgi:hypothetical protein
MAKKRPTSRNISMGPSVSFDSLPVKPKFQVGDRVSYNVLLIEDKNTTKTLRTIFGVVRHVRASIELSRPAPHITYEYVVGFDGELFVSNTIHENDLRHANPLLRLADET